MEKWKNIKINGISKIEKCVGEFNIWELYKSPYGKFKIKIYESITGNFSGYSNILVKDELGYYCASVGYGKTLEEALEDTIIYFFKMVSWKDEWGEEDFQWVEGSDF